MTCVGKYRNARTLPAAHPAMNFSVRLSSLQMMCVQLLSNTRPNLLTVPPNDEIIEVCTAAWSRSPVRRKTRLSFGGEAVRDFLAAGASFFGFFDEVLLDFDASGSSKSAPLRFLVFVFLAGALVFFAGSWSPAPAFASSTVPDSSASLLMLITTGGSFATLALVFVTLVAGSFSTSSTSAEVSSSAIGSSVSAFREIRLFEGAVVFVGVSNSVHATSFARPGVAFDVLAEVAGVVVSRSVGIFLSAGVGTLSISVRIPSTSNLPWPPFADFFALLTLGVIASFVLLTISSSGLMSPLSFFFELWSDAVLSVSPRNLSLPCTGTRLLEHIPT